MKIFKRIALLLGLLVVGLLLYADRAWNGAPLSDDFWPNYSTAKVEFDARGIPTIEADTWEKLMEAQGYVVASQRLFHMDLVRRAGAGRLAELMGPGLVAWDEGHRVEDWQGAADRAYEVLPKEQKLWVDAYAKGVNAFIAEHPEHVGIEYKVLGAQPEAWKPRDSLLVLMMMAFQLAQGSEEEAKRAAWKAHLPAEWFDFMFPSDHPYNRPLFGEAPRSGPQVPSAALPSAVVQPDEFGLAAKDDGAALAFGPADPAMGGVGASNSWAWCGSGKCFLANDPHLGATVPHIWYALRLRRSDKDWVVGVSIPGIPAVTLGMNPYVAWAFTNVGEDVDDYLEETISPDGKKYLWGLDAAGEQVWADIEVRPYEIKVRNGDPVTGEARFTHRGPLAAREYLGADRLFSRQWLPLQPGMLRLPLGVNRAKSWQELNAALDDMRLPAQNVVMVDYLGNIGYRASGTGVKRQVTGRLPQPALQGQWAGFKDWSTRPRMSIGPTDETRSATVARYLATANQRIWVDEFGERWANDLRADRINHVLKGLQDADHASMAALQMDTTSRYHRQLLLWVADRATAANEAQEQILMGWKGWSGEAEGHPTMTAQALMVEQWLRDAAVARVRQAFLPEELKDLPYAPRLDTAWMITALSTKDGFSVFGFDEAGLANALMAKLEATPLMPHPKANRWQAQHPFVGRVPAIGDRFKIPEPAQAGHLDVPRVESPKYGASVRLIWDMHAPKESTWAMPVGQSGHAASPHYSDFMTGFRAGKSHPVFEDDRTWWFAPRGPALSADAAP